MDFVTQRVTKDMRTQGDAGVEPAATEVPDRAAELAARGAALAEAAEAAERAGGTGDED
jgi:hypothetical protein